MEFPADIELCAAKVALFEEAYTVSLNVGSDWQTGLVGEIILQNIGEQELCFWELSFDTNICINSMWNASLTTDLGEGDSCSVKCCDDTAVIAPGGEVRIGFSATKDADIQPVIENSTLSHTSIENAMADDSMGDKEENDKAESDKE